MGWHIIVHIIVFVSLPQENLIALLSNRLHFSFVILKGRIKIWTQPSLVAQWWRICFPMQETQVWSLVQEEPTWLRAAKPVCHRCWACALEPGVTTAEWMCHDWRQSTIESVLRNRGSHCSEKPAHQQLESSPYSQLEESTQPKIHTYVNKPVF